MSSTTSSSCSARGSRHAPALIIARTCCALVSARLPQACADRQRHARASTSTASLRERDLLFALRKDPVRYQRVEQILEIYDDQKEARSSMNKGEKVNEKEFD